VNTETLEKEDVAEKMTDLITDRELLVGEKTTTDQREDQVLRIGKKMATDLQEDQVLLDGKRMEIAIEILME